MEATNILDVEKFVLECNDCLSGKFLDLNRRLEKLLSVMAQSEDVVALLSACLENFDDQAEFDAAFFVDKRTGGAKVVFPTDENRKLALIATIFNKLTAQQQNANQFLETFFQDGNLSPMQNFLDRVVKTFRDLVCKNFDVNPNLTAQDILKHELQLRAAEQERILAEQRAKEAEKLRLAQQQALAQQILQQQAAAKAAQEYADAGNGAANGATNGGAGNGANAGALAGAGASVAAGNAGQGVGQGANAGLAQNELQEDDADLPRLGELMAEVEKVANQIVATLKFERRHAALVDDLEFLANSITLAAQKGELMLVNGLVIGLEYASKKLRNVKHLVQNLHDLIYSYYDFLEDLAQGNQQNASEDEGLQTQGVAQGQTSGANDEDDQFDEQTDEDCELDEDDEFEKEFDDSQDNEDSDEDDEL